MIVNPRMYGPVDEVSPKDLWYNLPANRIQLDNNIHSFAKNSISSKPSYQTEEEEAVSNKAKKKLEHELHLKEVMLNSPVETEKVEEVEKASTQKESGVDQLEKQYKIDLENALSAPPGKRNLMILIVTVYSRAHVQNHQNRNEDRIYTHTKEATIWVTIIELQKSHKNNLGYGLIIAFSVVTMLGGAVSIGAAGCGFAGKFDAKALERVSQMGGGISQIGTGGGNLQQIANSGEKAKQVVLEQEAENDKRKRSEKSDSASQEEQQAKRQSDAVQQILKSNFDTASRVLQ